MNNPEGKELHFFTSPARPPAAAPAQEGQQMCSDQSSGSAAQRLAKKVIC